MICPNHPEQQEYITPLSNHKKHQKDWKNDILPRSIRQHPNFMVMGDTFVTVLFGHRYRQSIDSDSFIRSLSNVSYPSFLTLDYAPVETDLVNDKLINASSFSMRLPHPANASMIVVSIAFKYTLALVSLSALVVTVK